MILLLTKDRKDNDFSKGNIVYNTV